MNNASLAKPPSRCRYEGRSYRRVLNCTYLFSEDAHFCFQPTVRFSKAGCQPTVSSSARAWKHPSTKSWGTGLPCNGELHFMHSASRYCPRSLAPLPDSEISHCVLEFRQYSDSF